jgi:uncharacterized protein YaiI (UPF0178 family)
VSDGFDAADNWIAEQPGRPRAQGRRPRPRLDRKALHHQLDRRRDRYASHNGRPGGNQLGGPKPFAAADRSRFLQALDTAVLAVMRRG